MGPRRDPVGYDAGKKTQGIERHILVDTLGLMLWIVVHPASVQDRDGAALVLNRWTRRRFPFIKTVFADQGYQGPKAEAAIARIGDWKLEIVRPDPGPKGFALLPKRWIVERTLSWIRRNRRLANDLENLARMAEAFVILTMSKITLRRLKNHDFTGQVLTNMDGLK